MPAPSQQQQITALSTKVTALTMLVEALYVDELARNADPAAVGEGIIKSIMDTEKKARGSLGESAYGLQISEAGSSLIDRAVARAILRRSKGYRG
jgi:hypothetical protein